MLLPARMMETNILVHRSVLDATLKAIQSNSIMEIDEIKGVERGVSHSKTIDDITDYMHRIETLVEFMDLVKPSGAGGFKEMIFPAVPKKVDVPDRKIDEVFGFVEHVLGKTENQITDLAKELLEHREKLQALKKEKRDISTLKMLGVSLDVLGEGAYVIAKAGSSDDPHRIKKPDGVAILTYPQDEDRYLTLVVYHRKDSADAEKYMREISLEPFIITHKGVPDEALKEISQEIKAVDKKISELEKGLRVLRKEHYYTLVSAGEDLHNVKIREEKKRLLLSTEHTMVISGWTLSKRSEELESVVKESAGDLAVVKFGEAGGEDVPIEYNNPKALRPYESFVDMFAPPKYRKVEPTAIIGPLFVIYFGLTLGDFVYGSLVFLGGLILYLGMGKTDRTMKDFGVILTASGISAMIFGMMGGDFLGPLDPNTNNPIALFLNNVLGVGIPKFPIDSMSDPISILLIALIIGIAQLSLGLALGAYQCLQDKDYRKLVGDYISWFLLIPFGGMLIGVFFNWWVIEGALHWIAVIGSLVGLIFLFEIPFKTVNILKFFDLTGFIGNWLSYARLLALGLATAGIAMTINVFTKIIMDIASGFSALMICGPTLAAGLLVYYKFRSSKMKYASLPVLIMGIVGIFNMTAALYLFIIIFMIVGHLGNAVLQALGSFVHSLRLQYVEFFGTFYESGGKKFEPLKEERVYTVVRR